MNTTQQLHEVYVGLRMDRAIRDQLRELALVRRQSMSAVVRSLVNAGLAAETARAAR